MFVASPAVICLKLCFDPSLNSSSFSRVPSFQVKSPHADKTQRFAEDKHKLRLLLVQVKLALPHALYYCSCSKAHFVIPAVELTSSWTPAFFFHHVPRAANTAWEE